MIRRPPRTTRPYIPFPYPPLFRSYLKKTDRVIQAADRVLRLQVMPPGVSQVDLRLAAQFEKNSPEQNRADARFAQFQLAIDKRVATATERGASKEQLAQIVESAKAHVAATLREGKSPTQARSEEHTSELQSLMRITYAVFCLKKKKKLQNITK